MLINDITPILGATIPLIIALPSLLSTISQARRSSRLKSINLVAPSTVKVLYINREPIDKDFWQSSKQSKVQDVIFGSLVLILAIFAVLFFEFTVRTPLYK